MLSLIRILFGALFFLCCFGTIIVKNYPSHYSLVFQQETNLPWISVYEELKNNSWQYEVENTDFIQNKTSHLPSKNSKIKKNELHFSFSTPHYFVLNEIWTWNEKEKKIELHYDYELNFLSKLNSFFTPLFFKKIHSFGLKRFLDVQKKVSNKSNQHIWEYQGEKEIALTYYLAIEGESNWNDLESNVELGHEKLRAFAKENNIPLQKDKFTVFPLLSNKVIRWRAAIAVERFYRTNSQVIRCRRFKGGKALALVHKGTNKHLKKSWGILIDSLANRQQNYPLIQKRKVTIVQSENPLNWETILYIPIQQ